MTKEDYRERLRWEVYNGLVELYPNLYNRTFEEVFEILNKALDESRREDHE
jgi:hypothetical protein